MARELPGSYSELWPQRFLKADLLKGKKVTLTIKSIDGEDLIGENNKEKAEWLVKFVERDKELVMNRTNGFCLYRMFGADPHGWIGKRITLYPAVTKFGRETVDCIRVYGSPDIAEDMPITVPQGRKKAWETVMRAVKGKDAPATSATTPAVAPKATDPRIITAWEILSWNEQERKDNRAVMHDMTDASYLAYLNARIDQRDAEMNA